jgi:hypothetical protein
MPSRDYRLTRAKSLYKKYLCDSGGLQIPLDLNIEDEIAVDQEHLDEVLKVVDKLRLMFGGNMEKGDQEKVRIVDARLCPYLFPTNVTTPHIATDC